jgi:hypothetical protein
MDDPVLSAWRVDRTAVSITELTDPQDDCAYWLSRSPEERWEAIELMRRINYGDAATGRLQRVLAVAQFPRS